MGKFFEVLKRSEKSTGETLSKPLPAKVVKISGEEIDELRLYPRTQEGAPPLPQTPIGAADPKLVCLHEPTSPAAECFKILRSRLLLGDAEKPGRVIMVTSAEPQDGKSLVAANLAISIAQGIDSYVLLVDCDLRRPALHKTFGVQVREGLREYLEGGRSIESYLVTTPLARLTLIPAGRPTDSPSELLGSPRMRQLVEELKGRYQDCFLIFDTPPARFFADVAYLFSIVDVAVLVVRCGKTSRQQVKDLIDGTGSEKFLGVVFNASDEVQRDYKHYYRYYREGKRD